ncbi:aminoglycoside phosphotransferase family protein [Streptomyces sp. NPDC005423]|uniref:phosphotransferase family protein n=1 Tax=Streptomyces sp. NPDC005423 TaxID=3155343 RepID=UPI0033A522C2
MGAPPLPRLRPGQGVAGDVLTATGEAFRRSAERQGRASGGHHHQNHVLPLTPGLARLLGRPPGEPVTVRVRRPDALPVVIRTWQDEARVLDGVRDVLPHAPRCLYEGNGFALHSHVEGVPLSSVCGDDGPVDAPLLKALAGVLAGLAQVRRGALPPLPSHWPGNHTDSKGFLRTLVRLADRQIRQPNQPEFGGLFAALGIPEDALARLAERVPVMARRPYSLLHTDLHRDNVIMPHGGVPPLVCVDWELAGYGDPLHDLATHLVRMRYPENQWAEVVDAWAEAMLRVRPAAVNGLAKDLRHYVAFERAQSVYPDVMRAARSLQDGSGQKGLDEATESVRRALAAAQDPLRLRCVPGPAEIERILFRWHASRPGPRPARAPAGRGIEWRRDKRVPARDDFTAEAVRDALLAEGAAPAGRVFKGTAHLNSVVTVAGYPTPVVVRRKVADVPRREQGFLSEHAVLRAIEESGVEVAAPRILALGQGYRGETFAIHTYVGPDDIGRPPDHPVHGLLPHEADRLVDQLRALTGVNALEVDPAAGEGDFHSWLTRQLVRLVDELPRKSRQLARVLDLPDGGRLQQILGRHKVSRRHPALLHGDLNPWNLVRRDDSRALTIIDWEMAVVGDPLYDLVRHMHLTPTRPEIRDRMFRRWERLLPAEYTADWERDWRVYRWIEIVRSAYVDLDRLVTGAGLDAPNVRRAVDSYAMTLAAAHGSLGLPGRPAVNPCLARVLAGGHHTGTSERI